MNDELEGMWKEAFVLYCEVLFQHLTVGARKCIPLFPGLLATLSTHDLPDTKWRRHVREGHMVRRLFNDNASSAYVI
jgi:hypothetical protein